MTVFVQHSPWGPTGALRPGIWELVEHGNALKITTVTEDKEGKRKSQCALLKN